MKRADAPHVTSSMRSAIKDLDLERLAVIYPGARRYELRRRIVVVPVEELPSVSWRRCSDD